MSELTITALRLGFVLALWFFVFVTIAILRNDLFGSTVVPRGERGERRAARSAKPAPPAGPARSDEDASARSLLVTAGPLRGTSLHLGSAPVVIGRSPGCSLVVDDDYASNRHARVFLENGEWFVEDLGSTNGTTLSGRRLDGPAPFRPGAVLRIGRTDIELRRGPR